MLKDIFKPEHTYYCHHIPSGEDWVVIGVNMTRGKCMPGGWPNTIADIQDCTNWVLRGPIDDNERDFLKSNYFTYE